MIYFCIQSALREYGWRFFRHIAIKHPVKTLRAFFSADKIDTDADIITICGSREKSVIKIQGKGSIVGVGFCMKPIEPLCPSGRFNHDCLYLESILPTGANEMPDCCRGCYIRMLGLMTLCEERLLALVPVGILGMIPTLPHLLRGDTISRRLLCIPHPAIIDLLEGEIAEQGQ